MGNMSYCRFENTFRDLQDCYNALVDNDLDELSPSERKYAENLIELSKDIADYFSVHDEDEEE